MKVTLQKSEPIAKGISRLAKYLTKRAESRLSRSRLIREEDIHGVRICIKRMRSLLRLIRFSSDESVCREENTRLRNAAKGLAPLRDQHVMNRTLTLLSRKVAQREFRHLLETVRKTWFQSAKRPNPETYKCLRGAILALEECSQEITHISWKKDGWQALEPGLRRTYRKARTLSKEIRRTPSGEKFHNWRGFIKDLQAQTEIIEALASKRLIRYRKKLSLLAKLLGLDHDLVVLGHYLVHKGYESKVFIPIGEILDQMEKWSEHLRDTAQDLGDDLFSKKYGKWCKEFCSDPRF